MHLLNSLFMILLGEKIWKKITCGYWLYSPLPFYLFLVLAVPLWMQVKVMERKFIEEVEVQFKFWYCTIKGCARQDNGTLKMSTVWSPKHVNMFSYIPEGTVEMWLRLGTRNWEDNPGLYGWAQSNHMSL